MDIHGEYLTKLLGEDIIDKDDDYVFSDIFLEH